MINDGTTHTNVDSRPIGIWRLMMLTPTYLTTNPSKNVFELILPSLNHHQKTHYPLQVRACSFWGRSPLCPPLPGKVIKLSFSTSPKTLSPRFASPPVYREVEFSASQSWWDSEEFSGKLMTMLFPCITKRKLKLIFKKVSPNSANIRAVLSTLPQSLQMGSWESLQKSVKCENSYQSWLS